MREACEHKCSISFVERWICIQVVHMSLSPLGFRRVGVTDTEFLPPVVYLYKEAREILAFAFHLSMYLCFGGSKRSGTLNPMCGGSRLTVSIRQAGVLDVFFLFF